MLDELRSLPSTYPDDAPVRERLARSLVNTLNDAKAKGHRGDTAAHLDAIQSHAARMAGDSYGDVTVKAMAMAMERFPKVAV